MMDRPIINDQLGDGRWIVDQNVIRICPVSGGLHGIGTGRMSQGK